MARPLKSGTAFPVPVKNGLGQTYSRSGPIGEDSNFSPARNRSLCLIILFYELEVIVVQLLSRHLPRRFEDKHLKFPTSCEKRDSNPPSSAYDVGEVVLSTVTFALTKRVPLVSLKMTYLFDSLSLLYSPRAVKRLP